MMHGRAPEKALNFRGTLMRVLRLFGPERIAIIGMIFLAVLSVTANVLGPRVLGQATNIIFDGAISAQFSEGTPTEAIISGLRADGQEQLADMLSSINLQPGTGIDFPLLSRTALLALLLPMLGGLFSYTQGYVLTGSIQRTMYELRNRVEEKIHRVPLSSLDAIGRGELLSRVTNDIDNLAQTVQHTLMQAINAVLMVIGVTVMMFIVSPILAGVTLLTIPLMALVTIFIVMRSQKLFVAQWKHTGELNAQVEEGYTGHALVKVFGRSREVVHTFDEKNEELYRASFGAQFLSGVIMPSMEFIGNLVYVGIAVVGGTMVASGSLLLGDVQAFIQYARQFTQPLSQIGSLMNMLQSGLASAERVFELLDAADEVPDADPAQTPEPNAGHLVFDHVSFQYDPETPLITDLSLEAKPGSTVAIVGPTGAGKTTLVNLIMRFYDVDGGRITLNDVDIRDMARADLRSRVGMVLQDSWLFGGTIWENIAYGRPGASRMQIEAAAQAAYVDRFVHALPDGYDTILDDEAGNISVGERQLITIARAFLAEPSILILDEATSSVDTRTEVLVQHAMRELRSNRTSFVIAHRLSTIRDADVIVVMENGAIVEQGNHAELLDFDGAYARLHEAQFTEG